MHFICAFYVQERPKLSEVSMAKSETIHAIQALEKRVKSDAKEANSILEISKYLSATQMKDVRLSALNSLRRIFCEFLESGRLCIEEVKIVGRKKLSKGTLDSGASSEEKGKKDKTKEFKDWLRKHFSKFQDTLCRFISIGDADVIAPSLRTMMEFTQREWLLTKGQGQKYERGGEDLAGLVTKEAHFGVKSYSALLHALVLGEAELDVELLLMLRSEIFDKADCRFYTWLVIRQVLLTLRDEEDSPSLTRAIQNALDILRVLPLEDQETIDGGEYLVDRDPGAQCQGPLDGLDGPHSDSDSEDDNGGYVEEDSDEEGAKSSRKKRKYSSAATVVLGDSKTKKRKSFRKMTRAEQVSDAPSHQKVFSRAWLALLALPLSRSQHKLVLKHLPDHVITQLSNPLLLADYLTRSYEVGGSTSVLALTSLFTLIVAHNLDYPEFFPSLYRLCTVDNFSAKYRANFMSLLSSCLKSVNLQAYAVAAFAKRLMRLALVVPSPSALYCVAQVTWLLRNHPQCIVLLHRGQERGEQGSFSDEFDASEGVSLEKCRALQSSLWEALGLQEHHLHSVSTLTKSLESPLSTENSVRAPFLRVEDFLGHTYEALMDAELALVKRNAALAYVKPSKLLGGVTDRLFGV